MEVAEQPLAQIKMLPAEPAADEISPMDLSKIREKSSTKRGLHHCTSCWGSVEQRVY